MIKHEFPDKSIAILGANSHIAKWLIHHYIINSNYKLYLFTRNSQKLEKYLSVFNDDFHKNNRYLVCDNYSYFTKYEYDVIINCIGPGIIQNGYGSYTDFFILTETYDNIIINYLENINNNALYVCLSSGAVYGREAKEPAKATSVNRIIVNNIQQDDFHSISKLYSEAKHRAFTWLNIVDIRIFSYFSRYANLTESYLIHDIVNSIINNKVFNTGTDNIVRDYIHPDDLCRLINLCISTSKSNASFDAYSSKTTTKFEILDRFSIEFGLKYKLSTLPIRTGGTGYKPVYCSHYDAAARIGYQPEYAAIDALLSETRHILSGNTEGYL